MKYSTGTSPVIKRSVVIGGHKTSVSLEDEFFASLKEIAAGRQMTLADLIGLVDMNRTSGNLSSALRLFVLDEALKGRLTPRQERAAA
ncbi:ribbon-helix-helix domain-containing protein [Ancylobacter sp. A5.8]|uniref:ribbon-helix-helix domain-containing protein n=1 Tax=Ancylobacter gelatini TaxID=2919920 RepID=UPI001F4EE6C5|nr:ribbon-helix-helix domain-containing protein [Ancylobacter gelatini]MCJ8143835.1 ribbon-helix-helix domain-containing protein [Ancylobacter gelatini]